LVGRLGNQYGNQPAVNDDRCRKHHIDDACTRNTSTYNACTYNVWHTCLAACE
jgi:hypothetical protein